MEKNKNRLEIRKTSVYDDLYGIDTDKWKGIKEIVKVERIIYRTNKEEPSKEISFYISSKKMSAKDYNMGIRSHWSIENSLHYIKDVTFKEDNSLIRTGNAPVNFSIIRNIVINIFRKLNFSTFPQAMRMIGGDIKVISNLLA